MLQSCNWELYMECFMIYAYMHSIITILSLGLNPNESTIFWCFDGFDISRWQDCLFVNVVPEMFLLDWDSLSLCHLFLFRWDCFAKKGLQSTISEKSSLFSTAASSGLAWKSCSRGRSQYLGWPQAYLCSWLHWFYRNSGIIWKK